MRMDSYFTIDSVTCSGPGTSVRGASMSVRRAAIRNSRSTHAPVWARWQGRPVERHCAGVALDVIDVHGLRWLAAVLSDVRLNTCTPAALRS